MTAMADRFLREVKRMHQLRQDINEMTPAEADELVRGLGDDAAEDWIFAARDAQLPPSDLSWCWLFLGGRGAGKSHSMLAAVHTAVRAGIKRIHFIAPTTADFHDVNIEGKSGILARAGSGNGNRRRNSAHALPASCVRRNSRERTRTGRKKPGRQATQRVPSSEGPPPGTTQWTCGWCCRVWPQVWRTMVMPSWAPRCLGSAAMVASVSAAARNRIA